MRSTHFSLCFFNDTATTEIYTLSLHDALPISVRRPVRFTEYPDESQGKHRPLIATGSFFQPGPYGDRKSTRLNSSHANISYAVFCLTKNSTKTSRGRVGKRTHLNAINATHS